MAGYKVQRLENEVERLRHENARLARSVPTADRWITLPAVNGRMIYLGLPGEWTAEDYEWLVEHLALLRPALAPITPTP
jgi:hypothetical protein